MLDYSFYNRDNIINEMKKLKLNKNFCKNKILIIIRLKILLSIKKVKIYITVIL